ncbi:beta-lactamase family protein [Streptomyces mobaraensis NBRC 13819 = DSM 40847]|uniref:Beta-lactamase n=1 Tax=Streptomyces mobaraensis (strain ATCC 29032 / DSM 40847 / JCM 4168 / NBRC 13819 / NCIMB 11159 / IPCR 16-22) TaxID=1223523 RepID=M3BD96_STRM1|nr:serine hydrolase domain-containing protein [Streptomyces mobaraensis]EME97539.1 beta-lactamase [Streptomyces mobaraensis NBRC 13819 = DSM 40847]QTT73656.1 beta-lactamase family protein [Streptomyces mobaraensis NBRC 13819 = DSM 40847]
MRVRGRDRRPNRRSGRAVLAGGAVAAVAALLTGLTPATPSQAAAPNGLEGQTRTLDKDVRALRSAGGDVRVLAEVDTGRGVLRSRAGGGSAPTPWDARFRIASTTKTFTSVVVLQLAAEGKLSLDDTVEKWLPGVVKGQGNDGSRITVRDLLRQTSGLFDYVRDPELGRALAEGFDKIRYDTTPAAQWVAVAMRHRPLFTPDHAHPRWAYSNTNYLLAGMIAEKAGGLGWREQVEHRIIAPLGLRDTSVPGANPYLPGPHARVTLRTPDGKVTDVTDHSIQHTADSGVVSTTADLRTFFRALAGGKLLPPAQLREMRRTVARTGDTDDLAQWPDGGYGLGVRWTPLSCGGGYWHHEGDGFGSYTRTGVTPDGRRSVAVSITSDGGTPDLVRLNKAARKLADDALCGRAER